MQKKNRKLQQRGRQRQKLSRKAVIIIAASCITSAGIALTIFLNTGRVEDSMAAVSTYTIIDEAPVVEKTLEAPVLRELPAIGPNTLMMRPLKAEHQARQNHSAD